MSTINLLLTTTNGSLKGQKRAIEHAAKIAEEYAFPRLQIDWDIDVLVTDKIPIGIPENSVGGYTHRSDFIRILVNEHATEDLIAESFAHELCHAARWGKNPEWMNSLFDALIFEGIATNFEAEFAQRLDDKQLFIKTVTKCPKQTNEKILTKLRSQLDSNDYDYDATFFYGNDDLPRWAGYSLGHYLVQKYLKLTGKTIEDSFADKYADFRIAL